MRALINMLLASIIVSACTPEALQLINPPLPFKSTKMPETLDKLGVHDETTNASKQTVLIILQGGPHEELAFVRDGRTLFRYLPDYQNYSVVYLHQSQTINPSVMRAGSEFSIEDAKKEVAMSAAILSKAIEGYHALGKKVLVVSHSYGSFLALHHLSDAGPLADQYNLLAGRLDVDAALVDIHLSGLNAQYSSDGKTLLPIQARDPNENQASRNDYRNGNLLKAAAGMPRFSSELARLDLSNVNFIYAANDQAVGALTNEEVKALRTLGAQVIETHDGHGDTIKRFIDKVADGTLIIQKTE